MIRPAPTLATFALAVATACSSVTFSPDVAARVDEVERARLREHVFALDAIGPRPVSDVAATRATVDYIATRLRDLGYDVHEEHFDLELASRVIAVVRPVGEPDAEPTEIELAADLVSAGRQAMKAKSAQLVEEGWKVESFALRAAGDAQAFVVANLIATQRGSEPDRVIELSAHYDTVPYSPGADDNSSGVAALLEVARVVANARTRKTIRFCFFATEEIGLHGSREHLRVISDDSEPRVAGLINLDGVGFTAHGPGSQREPDDMPWFLSLPDEGDFVVVVGEWSSAWLGNLFEGAIDAYAPELPYYSANRLGSWFRDGDRSDHANYWRAGLPAIMVTGTGEFRRSTYHSPDDTADTIDYAFLESVTRATAAAALHWAELEPASTSSTDP